MAIACIVGKMFSSLLKNMLPLLQYTGHWYSPKAACLLSPSERNAASRHHKGGTKVCCLEYVAELTTPQPACLPASSSALLLQRGYHLRKWCGVKKYKFKIRVYGNAVLVLVNR